MVKIFYINIKFVCELRIKLKSRENEEKITTMLEDEDNSDEKVFMIAETEKAMERVI